VTIIEQLIRHRSNIIVDVKGMVEKYRATFSQHVPELDKSVADKLILLEIHNALKDIE
jgi:phosphopantothenate synthetase